MVCLIGAFPAMPSPARPAQAGTGAYDDDG